MVARAGLIALAVATLTACGSPRPTGRTGPAAEAMAVGLQRAVNIEAWEKTGAVRWSFGDFRKHLWDRERDYIRVQWGDTVVMRHLWSDLGRAWEDDIEVTDPDDRRDLMDEAYAAWVNDAYWLNPIAKIFDSGVERSVVDTEDGERGLLITYSSGGLTPGDSYLWLAGDDGLPRAWRMWVSIIPIGGVETSWEQWVTLSTGAKISTLHDTAVFSLKITDLAGAATLAELVEARDPFAPLAPP